VWGGKNAQRKDKKISRLKWTEFLTSKKNTVGEKKVEDKILKKLAKVQIINKGRGGGKRGHP